MIVDFSGYISKVIDYLNITISFLHTLILFTFTILFILLLLEIRTCRCKCEAD
jgi:hypothetical protein